jgi:hypothetical protein
MDADLYDEFGNYIGPELDSDEDEDDDLAFRQQRQQEDEVSRVLCVNVCTRACAGCGNGGR